MISLKMLEHQYSIEKRVVQNAHIILLCDFYEVCNWLNTKILNTGIILLYFNAIDFLVSTKI